MCGLCYDYHSQHPAGCTLVLEVCNIFPFKLLILWNFKYFDADLWTTSSSTQTSKRNIQIFILFLLYLTDPFDIVLKKTISSTMWAFEFSDQMGKKYGCLWVKTISVRNIKSNLKSVCGSHSFLIGYDMSFFLNLLFLNIKLFPWLINLGDVLSLKTVHETWKMYLFIMNTIVTLYTSSISDVSLMTE